jgi:hypothetical protein
VRRRLFNLAAAVSLVLCISSVALSVRSTKRGDLLELYVWDHVFAVASQSGGIFVSFGSVWEGPSTMVFKSFDAVSWSGTLGMGYYAHSQIGWFCDFAFAADSAVAAVIPHWFVACAFCVLPVRVILRKLNRSKRCSLNCCPTCGYDLRATPDCCPECGATQPAMAR